jgi:hypothetical protein
VAASDRVLVTTLTKRMAEDLHDHLQEAGVRSSYLHSEIQTFERVEILEDLRRGKYDVVVGVNLLREGLDLPEVALVAILDADKEGFLRSETSLVQTMGRAARHERARVILYADATTGSMQRAIGETRRRRVLQEEFNRQHGIEPRSIRKAHPLGDRRCGAVAEGGAGGGRRGHAHFRGPGKDPGPGKADARAGPRPRLRDRRRDPRPHREPARRGGERGSGWGRGRGRGREGGRGRSQRSASRAGPRASGPAEAQRDAPVPPAAAVRRARRGKIVALASTFFGLTVVAATGFAFRQRILEEWYFLQLRSAEWSKRYDAAMSLGEMRSVRAVPRLIEDVSVRPSSPTLSCSSLLH